MRILIAVPTFETIAPETFKSIYDLQTEHQLDFEFVKGYDCARARNQIAQKTIEGGYSAVLMVDSDMIIPKDTIERMLEFPCDIVLGVYPVKNTTSRLAEIFKPDNKDFVNHYTYDELTEPRIRIKGGGMGCAFIKTNAFHVLKYPWFKFVNYDNGTILSEDLYFCCEADKAGFRIEADTRVRCGHLARYYQYE